MTERANIYINQGAIFANEINFFNDGLGIDVNNYEFFGKIRILSIPETTVPFVITKNNGNLQLSLSQIATASLPPGKYVFDVIGVDIEGTPTKFLEGLAFVSATVSIGYTGSIGYLGSNGFTGSKGPRGYTGSSGINGYLGSTGFTGSTGPRGYTGSSGRDGSDGGLGFTGSKGPDGIRGITGFIGSRGSIGYTGSRGETGYQGSRGYIGSRGDTGISGRDGYTGSKGVVGFTGSKGLTGFSGSRGVVGYVGSRGSQGITGSQGIVGFAGSKGYVGSKGVIGFTGSKGFAGSQGSIGATGIKGYSGSRGDSGFTGSKGFAGSKGFSGSAGSVGFVGSRGSQGITGSQGIVGFAGSKGYVGSQGYSGSQGFSGYTGSRGVEGFTGSRGLQGTTGNIGYTGSRGFVGSFGDQGLTGYTGSQGNFGLTGYVGSRGVFGFTGSKGEIGLTGSRGSTGFVGSQGNEGIVGFAGSRGSTGFVGSQGIGYSGSRGFTGSRGSTGFVGSVGYTGSTGLDIVALAQNSANVSVAAALSASDKSALAKNYADISVAAALSAADESTAAQIYWPRFGTIALMQARTDLVDGKFIHVDKAFNGEQEVFVYDAVSTLAADGALIVDATGMGVGRLISTRTVYSTVAEMLADNRTPVNLPAVGSILTAGGFGYKITDALDHHVATAGGAKLYAMSRSLRAFGAVGNGIADDTAAIQLAFSLGNVEEVLGTYRVTSQITIPSGAKIKVAGKAAIFLDFHSAHGIISTDVFDCKVTLNIIGDDINPSGVLDAVRVTRSIRSIYNLTVKNSHDIGARFVDCDFCDITVSTVFTSFRGYAAILDGCNLCKAYVRGKTVNFGVLITGPYLDGGSQSIRSLSTYIGGVVLSAMIDDHEGLGVDVNGCINTITRDSVVANFTPTSYNSFGAAFFSCFQAKGGVATKGNKFINCQSISGAISFTNFGAGNTEFIDCSSFNAQWSPVSIGNVSNKTTIRGLYAENWGLNEVSVASYGGVAYAPIILITNGSNCVISDVVGSISKATPKKIAGIAVVSGTRNSFDDITLHMNDATPELVYGIYDNGSFSTYGEKCNGIFLATVSGVSKVFTGAATQFTTPVNVNMPLIGSTLVDSGSTPPAISNIRKASVVCFATFVQTRAFGGTELGEIAIGTSANYQSVLVKTPPPSSAILGVQALPVINTAVSTGLQVNYYKGVDTNAAFCINLHGFPA